MPSCNRCSGTGKCPACKGSGLSGFFLKAPTWPAAKRCRWCKVAGRCRDCGGTGSVDETRFRPYIDVLTSLRIPTSISVAAMTGAFWRHIQIPTRILQRSPEAQRGWVSWRVKAHFKQEAGKCTLFGDIVGYSWMRSDEDHVRMDVRGNTLRKEAKGSVTGSKRRRVMGDHDRASLGRGSTDRWAA